METEFKPNYVIHPGVILGNFIKELGLTQKEVAEKSGIASTTLNAIIKGKRNINASYALQLEPIFELPASYWINLQTTYEEAKLRLGSNVSSATKGIQQESAITLKIPKTILGHLKRAANDEGVTVEEFALMCLYDAFGRYSGMKEVIPKVYRQGITDCVTQMADHAKRQMDMAMKNSKLISVFEYVQNMQEGLLAKQTEVMHRYEAPRTVITYSVRGNDKYVS